MYYSKTKAMLKFYLFKILQLKKSIEKVGYFIVPRYDCFSYDQVKGIENKLENLGVIKLYHQGTGKWIDEDTREANLFTVDWNQLDCEYDGWMRDVPFVDFVKEFNAKPIKSYKGNKKTLLKDEDLIINPHINKKIPDGISRRDLIDCLDAKYPLKREIDEMLKEVNPHLVIENKGEFRLEVEKEGTLRRVSYRVTNSFTNLKKKDGSRDNFLKKNGLYKQLNGDIKSEIPRVTRLVHTGEWLPFTFDFYSHYLGKESLRKDLRDFVKAQNMPIYFTSWSNPEAFAKRQLFTILANKKHIYDDFVDEVKKNEKRTEIVLRKIKEGFDRETGKSFNSLIFLYTSWIETKALQILIQRFPNAKFFQIYDEIFSTKNCGDLEPVYREAAMLFYDRLSKITSVEFKNSRLRDADVDRDRDVDRDVDRDREVNVNINVKVNRVNNDEDVVKDVIKNLSLVSKLAGLSSTGVKFEKGYKGNKNAAGHHWKLSEETLAKRQPKSEETKEKIKSTKNEGFQKMVEFAIQLKQSEPYTSLKKTREKQQFIDKAIQLEFGVLSNVTLTKIRKAAK